MDDNFIARRAKSRTYLYRLALLEKGTEKWKEMNAIKLIDERLKQSQSFSSHHFKFHNFVSVFEHENVTELRYTDSNKKLF